MGRSNQKTLNNSFYLLTQMKKKIQLEFSPLKISNSRTIRNIIYHAEYGDFEAFDFLNDLAISNNFDLTECANLAWNEIKDRQGNTVNGTFIKN